MKYEIRSKSDFLTGSYLVTQVPENEVDKNALYTIDTDCPDFILPFHHKSINGQIEFTYKIGTLSKLQYFSGELSPEDYVELWQSLLKPLLDCGDWFMHPCSFVLSTDHLYFDKNTKAVSYVYIPATDGCSGYDAFYEMAVEVSKMMTVSDSGLENKVLRSILENFNPVDFLKMLKDHVTENTEPEHVQQSIVQDNEIQIEPEMQEQNVEDISHEAEPEIKIEKTKKEKDSGGYRIFSSKSKKKKTSAPPVIESANDSGHTPIQPVTPQASTFHAKIIDITQSTPFLLDGPGLRYVGRAHLPPSIQIQLSEGEVFTIGRFDAAVGKKQSSFEFDKKTKAVSRRHAVIERDIDGYKIIDLSSSAGTFVNDKKLPPNTPHGLEIGCRVSFGNSGADYVWEVS